MLGLNVIHVNKRGLRVNRATLLPYPLLSDLRKHQDIFMFLSFGDTKIAKIVGIFFLGDARSCCVINTNDACVIWPLLLTWFNFNPSMEK